MFLCSYSCDEGTTWHEVSFYPTQLFTVAMFTERGEKSQHVTIFAYKNFNPFEWLVIDIDFETLNLPNCSQADYYNWSPTDEVSTCSSTLYSIHVHVQCMCVDHIVNKHSPLSETQPTVYSWGELCLWASASKQLLLHWLKLQATNITNTLCLHSGRFWMVLIYNLTDISKFII